MQEVKRESQYVATLQLSTEADDTAGVYDVFVSLVHDWGDEVVAEVRATRTGALSYEYTFTEEDTVSAGVHRIKWRWLVSGDEYKKEDYIRIYTPYLAPSKFFEFRTELETEFEEQFDGISKSVRDIINTYCGQQFDFYKSKTMTFDGNGTSNLQLFNRLDSIEEVLIDGDDYTNLVEFVPQSKRFLRFKKTGDAQTGVSRTKFTMDSVVTVKGNWGWPYVPTNVSSAADLLIADWTTDDHHNFRYGIDQVWMDTQRFEFRDHFFETTGNIDADLLLMDYVVWEMDYVT